MTASEEAPAKAPKPKPLPPGNIYICRGMTPQEWLALPPRQRFSTHDLTSIWKNGGGR